MAVSLARVSLGEPVVRGAFFCWLPAGGWLLANDEQSSVLRPERSSAIRKSGVDDRVSFGYRQLESQCVNYF